MSFKGDFYPRSLPGGNSERHLLRHGRIQSVSDSSLFKTKQVAIAHSALVADTRSNGKAEFGACFPGFGDQVVHLERLARFDGDFAFALIDDRRPRLTLGLAPLSELELYYRLHRNGTVSFATGLAALLRRDEQAEWSLLAKALEFNAFFDEEKGFYERVFQVQPGTIVEFREGHRDVRRFWDPRDIRLCEMDEREAADRLRSSLEQAIASRLAAVPGAKASLLSAGRDSSAVTAIAARELHLGNGKLDAWTSAAFEGTEDQGKRLLDEAPQAAATAARFPNIQHHVVRPKQIDLCARLDQIHRVVAVPIMQPLALAWCETIWNACEANGNSLLLSGGFGNYALSAGGLCYLEDVRLESGLIPWLSRAFATAAAAPSRLRPLAAAMLGHRWRTREGRERDPIEPFFLGPLAEARRVRSAHVWPRAKSYRQWLLDGIRVSIDPTDTVRIGRRLETTDPTRDRGLVELMQSLPSKLLAGPDDRRRVYELAFGDLLPGSVLRPKVRGLQNVDWHYAYCPTAMKESLARYRRSAIVREAIDCDALAAALEQWPKARTTGGPLLTRMVWGALPALSMASFLYSRAPDATA